MSRRGNVMIQNTHRTMYSTYTRIFFNPHEYSFSYLFANPLDYRFYDLYYRHHQVAEIVQWPRQPPANRFNNFSERCDHGRYPVTDRANDLVYDLDHRPDQQENNVDDPVTNKKSGPLPITDLLCCTHDRVIQSNQHDRYCLH
jgi:hypothetical protein